MFSLVGIIILLFLFFKLSDLSKRVSKLEGQLKNQLHQGTVFAPASEQSAPSKAGEGFLRYDEAPKKDVVVEQGASTQVIEWLKNNWLSKLGVLLVLIGVGWFLSYAFVHNWIGPVGRIALGFGVGTVLTLAGAWLIGTRAVQANILLVLGSAIVLMTAYAARVAYDFFTPEIVLGLAFLVSACITTLSAVFNRERLAVYGVLVALAAPLLTHASEPSVVGLFVYLAVVSVASIWVSVAKAWGSVNFVAIVGVLLYCLPLIFGSSSSVAESDKAAVVVITLLLALAHFVVNIFQILRVGENQIKSIATIALANAILIFSVINTLVIEDMRSLLLAAWVIVFAIGSAVVSAQTRQQLFFYIYSLVTILFLGVASAIELEGPVLTIAFSLEAAIVTVLTYIVTKDLVKSAYMSLLMIIPVAVALPSLQSPLWAAGIFHNDALVVLLISLLLFLLGFFLWRRYQPEFHTETVRYFYLVHTWAGAFFAFSLVWLTTHALWSDSFATILSLTVFTVVGIGTYIHGTFGDKKTRKYFGAVVLIGVIGRLLIVDVWQMPLGPRIIVFIVVGILLVSTAFIGRKKTSPTLPSAALPSVAQPPPAPSVYTSPSQTTAPLSQPPV